MTATHAYTAYIEKKLKANTRKTKYDTLEPFDINIGEYEITNRKGVGIERKDDKRC